MEPVIIFDNYSFKYFAQSKATLKGIDLEIRAGEKVLIVGSSGSGKSTLGYCLNGLIPSAYGGEIEGSLVVAGRDAGNLDIFELSKFIGTVMQDSDAQFVGLSVAEDIAFALENDCVSQDLMLARVAEVASRVGLASFLRHPPQELSGGQKQRTSLAGILVDDVDILLFDEPLANLDPQTGKYAIELIDQIHESGAEAGSGKPKTTIIIEHRIEDVLHREVDRIILIDNGRIIADKEPHEIIASGLLSDYGLREPLYVTALKYAGVDVTSEMSPAYIWSMDFKSARTKFIDWYEGINREEYELGEDEVLSLRGLNFAYHEGRPVLTDVSFSVKAGEMLSIVGKNGAGKSTTAKLICGFEGHKDSEIFFDGIDAFNKSINERASFAGYVMQNPNQMITCSYVYDEVVSGLRLRKIPQKEINERLDRVLEICGLDRFKKWPIAALSYGQKKRVTIAAILILDPKIIILDEPTAGQDFRHYTDIMQFLSRINKLGITIILITHDMHLMLEYTRRSIVFCEGRIIQDADPSAVLTNSEIIAAASLKETSLYHLANKMGIQDPKSLVDKFVNYERTL